MKVKCCAISMRRDFYTPHSPVCDDEKIHEFRLKFIIESYRQFFCVNGIIYNFLYTIIMSLTLRFWNNCFQMVETWTGVSFSYDTQEST